MDDRLDSSRSGPTSAGSATSIPRAGAIPRRPRVTWKLGLAFALVFAALVTPSITAERWLASLGVGPLQAGQPAPVTIRIPAFSGLELPERNLGGGGVVIARGDLATADEAATAEAIFAAMPKGALPILAFFVLALVFGKIFAHHMRRSTRGRLVRVQIVSLISIALLAVVVKAMLLGSAASVLIVPVSLFAMLPTMVLDRVVGLATGVLAALVVSLLGPFDLGVAILMLVQAATAGLVVAERPKHRGKAALFAGAITTLFTVATYVLLTYLTTGAMPSLGGDAMRSPWLAAAIGPAIATVLAVPLIPLYQLLVGEITQGKLVELEDLSNPLLKQIAERSPGTWQHSLAMANMAEIAANSIGANGRLVRVGALYHDLGKSLQPKYFIENLQPGETSPHDRLPPEVSCDAIFAHVTEGIAHARKAGLHERIVDFMHMHHGNGVLEYFWGKVKEQGNPRGLTVEHFRYPGHPPQSRETAILAICDAVEAASRTLKNPTPASIDSLVQRIVYGKLHLGQLDESGLSMSDLRCVSDSLRETIRHANHGRIEYPWQKAQQDASAPPMPPSVSTGPIEHKPTHETSQLLRLDSLDRRQGRQTASASMSMPIELGAKERKSDPVVAREPDRSAEAIADTTDLKRPADDLAIVETAPQQRPADSASRQRQWDAAAADSTPLAVPSLPEAAKQLAWPSQTSVGVGPVPAQVAAMPKAAPADRLDEDFERERARQLDEVPGGARTHDLREDRVGGPGPAPDVIGPQTFAGPAPTPRAANDTGARKRAATLSPVPRKQSPTLPPVAPQPRTLPGAPLPAPIASPVPASEPARRSGLAGPGAPPANQTLLGAGSDRPVSPQDRRRAPTVPSDPPPNQPRPVLPLAHQVASRAATDPDAWSTGPTGEPRRLVPGDFGSRVAGLPAEPPGANMMATLRGPEAPNRLPASPEPPPKFPAAPSLHPDQSSPAIPPGAPSATPGRLGGPPAPVELDNAVTNPPPLRRGSGSSPPIRDHAGVSRLPGILLEHEALEHDARVAAGLPLDTINEEDVRVTAPRLPVTPITHVGHMSSELSLPSAHDDAGRTEPSLPRVDVNALPLRAPPTDPPPVQPRAGNWASGLAARVDAAIDEWGLETPIAPPSKAELRNLLGVPDPTKEQSLAEIERLHLQTRELQSDPAIFPPRSVSDTHEVHPDDIEASIEVAPRARTQAPRSGAQADRSPEAIGVAKPKPK